MRQIAAVLILISLFLLLVGSRFEHSDGDRLSAITQLVVGKVRDGLPPAERIAGPIGAFRKGLPDTPAERVKSRLEADKRFTGIEFTIAVDGSTVILRGVVPDAKTRRQMVTIAENTNGVEKVVDELAIPAE